MDDQPPSSTAPEAGTLDSGPFRAKPSAARRAPQEKKRLSYDKDRRNAYGENDKASRKNLPRHKRRVNQTNRRRDRQAMQGSTGIRQPGTDDIAEDRLHARRRKKWRKSPDETLRQAVQRKLRLRQHDN